MSVLAVQSRHTCQPVPPPELSTPEELRAFFLNRKGDAPPGSVMHALRHYSPQTLALALVQGVLSTFDEATSRSTRGREAVVVFVARKMACLYWVLKLNGLPVPAELKIRTDRFALLRDAHGWKGKDILLRDDTWVRGDALTRRCARLESFFKAESQRTPAAGSSRESGTDVEEDTRIFPQAFLNADGKRSASSVAWHRDAQPVIAQTLADAGVPYFTDFPVTEEFFMTKSQLVRLLDSLDPNFVDVTNASIGVSGNFAYTLSIDHDLNTVASGPINYGSLLPDQVRRGAYAMKLRVFARRVHGLYGLRFMPIVILATQSVTRLEGIARDLGIDIVGLAQLRMQRFEGASDLDTALKGDEERTAAETLKQLFGYVEYLASELLFDSLQPSLVEKIKVVSGSEQSPKDVVIDEELSQFILGDELWGQRREHKEVLCNANLDLVHEPRQLDAISQDDPATLLLPTLKASSTWGKSGSVVLPWPVSSPLELGDDLVEPIDLYLNSQPQEDEPVRVPFSTLRDDLHTNSWTVSLALDVLNDLGRVVPDQILVFNSEGRLGVSRSYRYGEASNPLKELRRSVPSGRLARQRRTLAFANDKCFEVFRLGNNDQVTSGAR